MRFQLAECAQSPGREISVDHAQPRVGKRVLPDVIAATKRRTGHCGIAAVSAFGINRRREETGPT
jgi:hypothetical protein